MEFEHFALNVPDPKAMAAWYVKYCRMRIVSAKAQAPFAHFLVDKSGRVVLEIYSNPAAPIPNYAEQHPLRFHVAFAVNNLDAVKERLITARATLLEEQELPDGTRLIMLRDPWGVPLQLCKRSTPF